jgi:hypothetical protein
MEKEDGNQCFELYYSHMRAQASFLMTGRMTWHMTRSRKWLQVGAKIVSDSQAYKGSV